MIIVTIISCNINQIYYLKLNRVEFQHQLFIGHWLNHANNYWFISIIISLLVSVHPLYSFFLYFKWAKNWPSSCCLFSILYNLHSIAQQPNLNTPIQIGEAVHMLSMFPGVEIGYRAGNLVAYIELAGLEKKKISGLLKCLPLQHGYINVASILHIHS